MSAKPKSPAHHELWCLVEGGNIPFSINPSSTICIAELKIMIVTDRIQTNLAAPELILWKVRYF